MLSLINSHILTIKTQGISLTYTYRFDKMTFLPNADEMKAEGK